MSTTPKIILASTSSFRKALLEKLHLPFITASPETDETRLDNETAESLVLRLAKAKALAVADNQSGIIIGSDQVAVVDGKIIGKPLSRDKAIEQLKSQSGKTITFYTGLAVFDTASQHMQAEVEPFHVTFRKLTQAEIEAYVDAEEPWYCAGSFKSEGLGITLFDKLQGRDPNTLIGLPLILLCEYLRKLGLQLPA
ncbi:Maf-like protein [Shewanella submarina]|uniref:7-methyl-GTP pyrophosphatase n=1 Tax=Shewanella submarina TaxID=2016376 RepID=A0ABV7GCN9_9GAMM|nr:nucleoside triphosphate pyrophosphatase [Shewanella submarina]MCL1039043.1 Maf-like protein [Shewanella submarina]